MIRPFAMFLLLLHLPLWAEPVGWTLGEKSRAELDGDSTLRAWNVEADRVHGEIFLPWGPGEVADFLEWIDRNPENAKARIQQTLERDPPSAKATLKIRVEELESGNDRMERDMREALKAKKHPWIVYTFESVRSVSVARTARENDAPPSLVLHTRGSLALAGTEKKVDLDFDLSPADGGYLLVSRKTFEMTDFGIQPPTALFGLLKAHDEVDIRYRIHVVPGKAVGKPDAASPEAPNRGGRRGRTPPPALPRPGSTLARNRHATFHLPPFRMSDILRTPRRKVQVKPTGDA